MRRNSVTIVTIKSKNWHWSPPENHVRLSAENVSGPRKYAVSWTDDKSCFELFMTVHRNHSGKCDQPGREKQTFDIWKEIIQKDAKAYMSLLILSGVHRSRMDSRQFFRPPCHSRTLTCCYGWFALTIMIHDQVAVNKTNGSDQRSLGQVCGAPATHIYPKSKHHS